MNPNRLLFSLVLLISSTVNAQFSATPKKWAAIDKFIDSTLNAWNVPGLALAVVYKDKLIYGKGYGYRDIEKKLPIDKSTLFPIASNTKLFTATTACILAGEGLLSLDKPVQTYLPWLRFYNDDLNAKVTSRDMLSHRTGLPRYDGIWVNSSFTRKQMVEKVSYMKPALGFREGYLYNNLMFVTAGAALEAVTGKSWEDLVRSKIFGPLSMKTTCFTDSAVTAFGNYAVAYFQPDSSRKLFRKQYEGQCEALGPAGTIKSSIEDMSHWMIAQLNAGKYGGAQAIPAKAIAETLIPNNISDKEGKYPELSNSIYCLGRTIQMYKGHKATSHGGAIDGFFSYVMLFPNDSIGIFVVVNADHARPLSNFVPLDVFDKLMGMSSTPWNERYMKDYVKARADERKNRDSTRSSAVPGTKPSHDLNAYAGLYSNPLYGDMTITVTGDHLQLQFRKQQTALQHFHYDQFITNEEKTDLPDWRLSFVTGDSGAVEHIATALFGDPEVMFTRK